MRFHTVAVLASTLLASRTYAALVCDDSGITLRCVDADVTTHAQLDEGFSTCGREGGEYIAYVTADIVLNAKDSQAKPRLPMVLNDAGSGGCRVTIIGTDTGADDGTKFQLDASFDATAVTEEELNACFVTCDFDENPNCDPYPCTSTVFDTCARSTVTLRNLSIVNALSLFMVRGAGAVRIEDCAVSQVGFRGDPQVEAFGVITGTVGVQYSDDYKDPLVVLKDSTFTDNHGRVGGVVNFEDTSERARLVVEGCTFTENSAFESAGAIYVADNQVTIEASSFVDNESGNGGAMVIGARHNDMNLIAHTNFTGNKASYRGGAVYIYQQAEAGPIDFIATNFVSNRADAGDTTGAGGAVSIDPYGPDASPVRFSKTTFVDNTQGESVGDDIAFETFEYANALNLDCTSDVPSIRTGALTMLFEWSGCAGGIRSTRDHGLTYPSHIVDLSPPALVAWDTAFRASIPDFECTSTGCTKCDAGLTLDSEGLACDACASGGSPDTGALERESTFNAAYVGFAVAAVVGTIGNVGLAYHLHSKGKVAK